MTGIGRGVVVGSRGRGGSTGLVLGSTSTAVAMHASCPVVVVHRGRDLDRGGPVVVGVDGSQLSEAAVAWAFDAAAQRGTGLTAVHAWLPPWGLADQWAVVGAGEWEALARSAAATLSESLVGWSDEHPGVVVEERVVQAHPGTALADASRGAQLVVVGCRGRGGFAGLVLGSVSRAVLHHAGCPVAVVHPDHHRERGGRDGER